MSDYGYRPAPPPEDGRAQGRGAGQQGGRAYGTPQGSNDPDRGWGGGRPGGAPQGPPQSSPPPRRSPYGTPASGSAAVGRGAAPAGRGSASVGRGAASVPPASGSASVGPGQGPGRSGRASVGSASVGSASVGSASVGSASVSPASAARNRPGGSGGPGDPPERGGRRRAGKGPEGGKKKRRLGRKMLAVVIAMGILFIAAVTIVGTYFFQSTPPLSGIAYQGESSAFYLADGDQAGAYGDTLRLQATEEEIPETVTDALVALEDRKFWDHGGVDYAGTMRALINNIKGGETQGASTITQQYAGMYMDARDEASYDRKAKEAALAMKMEDKYSKKEIITAYLNMAYFGRGAYGIEAAAKNYFNVPLADITYDQAAFIVMQVKSPNGYYDPYYEQEYNEGASKGRWNYTMNALVETGQLSQSERDAFEYPEPITDFNASGSWGGNTDIGFIINEQDGYVFDELLDRYGLTRDMLKGNNEEHPKDERYAGGYQITLTIDPEIQAALKTTGSRGEIEVEKNEDGQYLNSDGEVVSDISDAEKILTDEGYVQFSNSNEDAALFDYVKYMMTAMVAIDPKTGEVLGYYGGDNGFGVDKAGAESPHPPSSTFKMVTAALALSQNDSPESWFNADSPRVFDTLKLDDIRKCIGDGDYPDCGLRNGTQSSKNLEMTLTDAVRKSKNTPMYGIAEHYGADAILALADEMGLTVMNQSRSIRDEEGNTHDVSVNYVMDDNGTYTQHGAAVDADGNAVTDASGNWDVYADIKVDDNCQPIVNLEGQFLAADESTPCNIGDGGKTDPFYYHLAFGQYPTSVRDMASIYATIANDGVYNESHFVAEVRNNKGEVVEPKEDSLHLNESVLDASVARNLQWIGSEIAGETDATELDRDYFGKTGTWEAAGYEAACRNDPDTTDVSEQCQKYSPRYSAHAWYVGAIPQLSIAAWVGNVTSESDPIANDYGDMNGVYGSNTAQPVWYKAMTRVLDAKEGDEAWDEVKWEGKVDIQGNKTYWDIENAGGPNEGGEFCKANPENELCKDQVDRQAQEDCVAEGGTWDGETCTPADDHGNGNGRDEPTTDPTDPETGGENGENCGGLFQQPCDDPTTPSEDESTTPPEDGGGGNDNGNGNNGGG